MTVCYRISAFFGFYHRSSGTASLSPGARPKTPGVLGNINFITHKERLDPELMKSISQRMYFTRWESGIFNGSYLDFLRMFPLVPKCFIHYLENLLMISLIVDLPLKNIQDFANNQSTSSNIEVS